MGICEAACKTERTRKCRKACSELIPLIFVIWFAVSLIVVLVFYNDYRSYLVELQSITDLFAVGFTALALSLILCIFTFVFIRCDLIGPCPLVSYIILWIAAMCLLIAYAVLVFQAKRQDLTENVVTRIMELGKAEGRSLPLVMRRYQVTSKCCMLFDKAIKWDVRNETRFSCCTSIVRDCSAPGNSYGVGCVPELVGDYYTILEPQMWQAPIHVFLMFYLGATTLLRSYKKKKKKRKEGDPSRKMGSEGEEEDHETYPEEMEHHHEPEIFLCLCTR